MMNKMLSRVLKTGLYSSLAITVLGLVLVTMQHIPTEAVKALPFGDLLSYLLRGNGTAVLDFGLVLLMLTPVARVVAAVYGYIREGDRRFALISFVVLVVLSISFIVASLTGTVAG